MRNAFVASACSALLCSSLTLSDSAQANTQASYSLRSTHRLMGFLKNNDKALGQEHWLQFEPSFEFAGGLSFHGQALASAGDYRTALYQSTDKTDISNQASELWAGDLYAQYAAGPFLMRAGYQRISWQEGFSFSYTNFINPRDQRISLFEDSDLVSRSVPMVNAVVSGENLSLQFLLIPFTTVDFVPPFSRLGRRGDVPLQPTQKIELQEPRLSSGVADLGLRTTWAGEGFDISFFAARIHDRQGYYELDSASDFSRLLLRPAQTVMSPFGFTSSVVAGEGTWRIEYMRVPSRRFNRISNLSLQTVDVPETDITVGYDSPTWDRFSMGLQHSLSLLAEEPAGLLRRRQENLSFARLDYNVGTDRNLRLLLAYLHADQSAFGRLGYRWPLNRQIELEVALETSGGSAQSQGIAMSDMTRFYCQLTHTL